MGSPQNEHANRYRFNAHPYSAHSIILSAIEPGSTVLDVGCGSGYLAEHCRTPNVTWYGMDFDATAVAMAKDFYKAVCVYDLNSSESFPFDGVVFDTIIMADVLEHIINPEAALFDLVARLKAGGRAVISLPNVANFTVRFRLLRGRFDYGDTGILDRTHLHLYTKSTAVALAERCGLIVSEVKSSSDHFGHIANRWPVLTGLLAYNIVLLARTPAN